MDDVSAEMFLRPRVKVAGYLEAGKNIDTASRKIFGRVLAPDQFVELFAAPNGSEMFVEATGEADVDLRIAYHHFQGSHEYALYLEAETGKRVVEFVSIVNNPAAPSLLETRLFARQVKSFRKYGIDEIRLLAEGFAGHPGSINGYYVWPRLGFSMDLGGFGPALNAAGYSGVRNTLDLFLLENGRNWWYTHGEEREAVFYLSDGSPCFLALQAYLQQKGINVDE